MQVYRDGAQFFKVLCEPVRLLIIDLLSCNEMCACEILECLSISQSTLSHHMKVLIDNGLVISRKEATWMHYTLNRETIARLLQFINTLTQAKADCICFTSGRKNKKRRS